MLDRLNAALDLLERNLADGAPVDTTAMARVAATSEHHVRRMFSALAGMPIGEYARRRRMTIAAADVLGAGAALLDVAVRHGYGSTEAFTRAFRAVHGVSPGQVRRDRSALLSQPRITFHITVEGSAAMRYRIVEKSPFRIVGVSARVPLVHLGRNTAIEQFVRSVPAAVREEIAGSSDQDPAGVVSVIDGLDEARTEGAELDFWHAAVTSRPCPDDLDCLEVPAGAWLVLTGTGSYPEAMQQLWRDAYGQWFPSNPWRTRPGPELLRVELHADGTGDAELWLPIEPDQP
jgi:AraC family transcriptional regulator